MTIAGQVRSCTSPSANAFSHCFWLDAWEMDQLSHRVSICSVLSQTAGTFSRAAGAPHPRQQRGEVRTLTAHRRSPPAPDASPPCLGFISHFPTRFHVRAIHSHIFFCELSVHFPCFLCLKMLLLLTCVCHLYSPGTCLILRISFRNIFSQSATCLYFMVLSFDGILNFDEV